MKKEARAPGSGTISRVNQADEGSAARVSGLRNVKDLARAFFYSLLSTIAN